MGLKDCKIIFDNPWNTYYAGQTVSGRVELVLDSSKKVRGVELTFKGQANTRFTVTETRRNHEGKDETIYVDCTGEETYFKIQYYVVGGANGPTIELPPGNHTYTFTCVLPPVLPSSFEGQYGHIRYTVKATLDRPWKFDQEIKAAFTVLSPVDLNLNPVIRQASRQTLEKYFCCCCCQSGPLTCVVSIPCIGYVPGQAINILTEVDNISNVEVNYVKYELRKTVVYYVKHPHRDSKKDQVKILETRSQAVAPGGSSTWTQSMIVPPIPPSNLTNCGIIDLDYDLKIEVIVSGMHTNPETKIPIVIGTIPLVNMPNAVPIPPAIPSNLPQPSAPTIQATAPHLPTDSATINIDSSQPQIGWSDRPPAYSDLPPPTYTESMFGTTTIQDNMDNQYTKFTNNDAHYNPMYPVYNFNYPGLPQLQNSAEPSQAPYPPISTPYPPASSYPQNTPYSTPNQPYLPTVHQPRTSSDGSAQNGSEKQ